MVIIGLLLIALVCLIVGIVLPNTAWLLASLIASAGAGYLLWRSRAAFAGAHVGSRRSAAQPADTPASSTSAAAVEAGSGDEDADHPAAGDETSVLSAVREEPVEQASTEPTATAVLPSLTPDLTTDLTTEPADLTTEPADLTTEPDPVPVAPPAVPLRSVESQADEDDVWVIDGRPRYHLAHCAIIQGQDAEPIPFEQATADGFMPCSLCEPNAVRAG